MMLPSITWQTKNCNMIFGKENIRLNPFTFPKKPSHLKAASQLSKNLSQIFPP